MGLTDQRTLSGAQGRPRTVGRHRVLVYCTDDAPSVYAKAYGWWCMDCPAGRDPEADPTTKSNAERRAGQHGQLSAQLVSP